MKNNKLLSIVIPVYNVEKYLERCLNSIYEQATKNIEVVLVDDGSIDKSSKICDDYDKKDIKTIVLHTKNRGLSAARNLGMQKANGEYIFFVDSDDYIESKTIKAIENIIIKQKPNLIFGNSLKININGIKTLYYAKELNEGLYNINCFLNIYKKTNNYPPIPTHNYIYKKDFLLKNNIKFKQGIIYEDELWTQCVLTNTKEIFYLNKTIYIYCIRNDSITTSSSLEKSAQNLFIIAKEIDRLYRKQKSIPKVIKNRYSEILLNINWEIDDPIPYYEFCKRIYPIKYAQYIYTFKKALLFLISPKLHRKYERLKRLGMKAV